MRATNLRIAIFHPMNPPPSGSVRAEIGCAGARQRAGALVGSNLRHRAPCGRFTLRRISDHCLVYFTQMSIVKSQQLFQETSI